MTLNIYFFNKTNREEQHTHRLHSISQKPQDFPHFWTTAMKIFKIVNTSTIFFLKKNLQIQIHIKNEIRTISGSNYPISVAGTAVSNDSSKIWLPTRRHLSVAKSREWVTLSLFYPGDRLRIVLRRFFLPFPPFFPIYVHTHTRRW